MLPRGKGIFDLPFALEEAVSLRVLNNWILLSCPMLSLPLSVCVTGMRPILFVAFRLLPPTPGERGEVLPAEYSMELRSRRALGTSPALGSWERAGSRSQVRFSEAAPAQPPWPVLFHVVPFAKNSPVYTGATEPPPPHSQ